MKGLARRFGEDDPSRLGAVSLAEAEEKWGLTGLLHDIDYEQTQKEPEKHSLVAVEILEGQGLAPEIIDAIKVHNHMHGMAPETLLAKALFCAEGLTGFFVACALVQPDKKLVSVNLDSAMKKFKTKSFAAGANREIIGQCEGLLGIKLEELMTICLREMQGIAGELGL